MKPAASIAVVTIVAICVIAEVFALAEDGNLSPVISAIPGNIHNTPQIPLPHPNLPPGIYETHPLLNTGSPVSIRRSWWPKTLAPGIYEMRPYAMMLGVPGPTGDNSVRRISPPPMPIRHPELEAIPKVASVPTGQINR